jgi:hypothetical protein
MLSDLPSSTPCLTVRGFVTGSKLIRGQLNAEPQLSDVEVRFEIEPVNHVLVHGAQRFPIEKSAVFVLLINKDGDSRLLTREAFLSSENGAVPIRRALSRLEGSER